MIDRVNLNRLIGQAFGTDKKVRRKEVSEAQEVQGSADMVEISDVARKSLETDYEDISQKVQKVKEQITEGTYEVNADKIVEGFKKFFS